ncbi:MAG TPA: hypothetical protein VFR75_03185 [Solirubrobacterales bacterium]|nr:hypothetical protein [Solirubrobacterales bacterium]
MVERLGPHAERKLDLLLPVPVDRPVGDLALPRRPGQQLLGERRAVVGQLGLAADDPHRAVVAAPAQPLGDPLGGEAAADDQGPGAAHPSSIAGLAASP